MINRQNWLDTRAYLAYLETGREPASIHRSRAHLRHLLEWADETPLTQARHVDPAYPVYLVTARADDKPGPLSRSSVVRGLSTARQFFAWARAEWPKRYKTISESWIRLLQPTRDLRLQNDLRVHEFYTLADISKIAAVSVETLREQRAQAGACLLYLSGMRADALASLPVAGVDLPNRQILQLPQMGVRTKNRKAAITYLLNIPALFDLVAAWDRRVRPLSPVSLWYATLTTDGMSITETTQAYTGRFHAIEDDLRLICARAGVPYLSPHKLRHGHVIYALKRVKDLTEFKAVSQNVMHANIVITDQIYGAFTGDDIKNIIANLGQSTQPAGLGDKLDELIALLKTQRES